MALCPIGEKPLLEVKLMIIIGPDSDLTLHQCLVIDSDNNWFDIHN